MHDEITIRLDAFAVRLQRLEVIVSDHEQELDSLVEVLETCVASLRADLDQLRSSLHPGVQRW
jgi:hypothetical protein